MVGGFVLYVIGIALYVVSALIYFAIVKAIFWRDAPERGLLFFGASLFVASKLLSLVGKILSALLEAPLLSH
jgi:hypothetical protein